METLQYGKIAMTIPLTSPDNHRRFWISWNASREAVQVRIRGFRKVYTPELLRTCLSASRARTRHPANNVSSDRPKRD